MQVEDVAAAVVGEVQPTIAVRGVTKRFQAITALRDVSIDFLPGSVHVLFGENGAGKSTLIGVLAGVHRPDEGALELDGAAIAPQSPREAMALGISSVFQEPALVPQLTVAENLELGRERTRHGLLRRGSAAGDASKALSRIGSDIRPGRLVRDLNRAERQIVEIARALQGSAKVLILDEPTASLTSEETDHLFQVVERLRDAGLAIIYITHRMQEIRRIGDTISVLRDGRLIRTTTLSSVTDAEIVTLMTGREVGAIFPDIDHRPQAPALELDHVAAGPVHDASIVVHRGEVVGVAGLVGCGKAQLGQLCFGLLKPTTGSIRINGSEVHRHCPSDRLAQGVVFYPADRKRDGLIETRSAAENATLAALPRWSPLGLIKRSTERADAVDVLQRLNLRPMSPDALPSTFSGGNQQKIVLARGFAGDYDIHVFDEPTAGVDVGARSEIYLAIKDLAASGAAVLIISSDLPEIVGLAHRAYVMCEGRVVGEFTGDQLQESTMLPAFFAHAQEGRSS